MYIGLGISLQSNKCCCKAIPPSPPDNTVTAASTNPTLCINTELIAITHETTGATGIGLPTGLPAGVTASWEDNIITIEGTPTVSEVFNYSIPLTGGSGTVFATGTITVLADNTAEAPSSIPTVCIDTELIPITHVTTGATGIGIGTNLPTGVTASWIDDTVIISGTPLVTGSFGYSIPLTGGCNLVYATGSITVNPNNTVSTASSTPTLEVGTALTPITHTTTGATGIGTATGLPTQVTASWSNNVITISGTPIVTGSFNYSIPLTGGCSLVNATGSITVGESNTASEASSNPTLCIDTALIPITHTTTGATGIGTATGLPAGVTATLTDGIIRISGTPSTSGTFNYNIPLTGGIGTVSATGTIIVRPANTVSEPIGDLTLSYGEQPFSPIRHNTTGATGIGTATGLPSGLEAFWVENKIFIQGVPQETGSFNYSIPLTGGCSLVYGSGTIVVTF
jgi:hypothetical protein